MKVLNNVFGNGCVRNIYSFLDLKMPRQVKIREETLYKNIMNLNNINSINKNQKNMAYRQIFNISILKQNTLWKLQFNKKAN